MKYLLLFLTSVSCWGQAFSPMDLPWYAHGNSVDTSPTSITGLEYWWHAADLGGTGSIQPSNTLWTDRIQSKAFKLDTTTGAGPVVTSVSITFAGTSRFTNTIRNAFVWPSTGTVFRTLVVIIKPTAGHTAINQCYLGPIDDTDTGIAYLTGPKLTYDNGFTLSPNVQANANIQDLIFYQTNVSNSSVGIGLYTNNVLSVETANNSANVGKVLYALASTGANNAFMDVYDILSYTNATRPLNSTERTTLHNYFTNSTTGYNFAP